MARLDLAELADDLEHSEKHLLQRARMNAMLEVRAPLAGMPGAAAEKCRRDSSRYRRASSARGATSSSR